MPSLKTLRLRVAVLVVLVLAVEIALRYPETAQVVAALYVLTIIVVFLIVKRTRGW